jgi:hypothetical protein
MPEVAATRSDPSERPPTFRLIATGRFKRSLLGYRRDEVDRAVAGAEEQAGLQRVEIQALGAEVVDRERRIEHLERVATRLSERVVEREGELRALRAELARSVQESDAHLATLTALIGELEDVRRTARGQATRIRLAALREAAELSERIGEMTKRPAGMRERLLESLTEAIARIGGDQGEVEVASAETNGRVERDAVELFDGMVEVEIGPLSDFAQLVLFEDAAKSISATSEVSVTRFSGGRATLEMALKEPVALLRELEERCDLEFVIRDMRGDRVVLDVGAE